MPHHQGFGHLTLTVTDLEQSADFYNRVLGSQTAMASEDELEKWVAHLGEHGVNSSGIVESPFGLHLHAKDPDGIAIEFFVAAQD